MDNVTEAGPSRRPSALVEPLQNTNLDGPGARFDDASASLASLSESYLKANPPSRSFFHILALQPCRTINALYDLDTLVDEFEEMDWASPLDLVTRAIAVRSIANYSGSESLIAHTNRLYELALQAADDASDDMDGPEVEEASNSIMLFALYECVASGSAIYWSLNQSASTELLQSNRIAQTGSASSIPVFREARRRMFLGNSRRRTVFDRVSAAEQHLKRSSAGVGGSNRSDYPEQMADVFTTATELLLPGQSPTLTSTQQVEGILAAAYGLQNELHRWDMNMPPQLGYKSVGQTALAQNTGNLATLNAWPGPIHIYRNVRIASIRNHNRVSQLLCCNVVMEALEWLQPDDFAEDGRYKAAEYRVQYLVDDIAASMPSHYGYGDLETSSPVTGVVGRDGYLLIWPLYVASQMASIPAEQRRWLTVRLDTILQNFGLERSIDRS